MASLWRKVVEYGSIPNSMLYATIAPFHYPTRLDTGFLVSGVQTVNCTRSENYPRCEKVAFLRYSSLRKWFNVDCKVGCVYNVCFGIARLVSVQNSKAIVTR